MTFSSIATKGTKKDTKILQVMTMSAPHILNVSFPDPHEHHRFKKKAAKALALNKTIVEKHKPRHRRERPTGKKRNESRRISPFSSS
jgi:hypothetical protein